MAIVAGCYAIVSSSFGNLIEFKLAVVASCFRIARLKKTAASAATVIVALVGRHVDKVLIAHYRFDHKTQIFGHRVAKGFSYQLAGILYRKLGLHVLVPVAVYFQLSVFDPLSIILDDTFYFKVCLNIKFLQPEPDCEQFMASFRVQPNIAA